MSEQVTHFAQGFSEVIFRALELEDSDLILYRLSLRSMLVAALALGELEVAFYLQRYTILFVYTAILAAQWI